MNIKEPREYIKKDLSAPDIVNEISLMTSWEDLASPAWSFSLYVHFLCFIQRSARTIWLAHEPQPTTISTLVLWAQFLHHDIPALIGTLPAILVFFHHPLHLHMQNKRALTRVFEEYN